MILNKLPHGRVKCNSSENGRAGMWFTCLPRGAGRLGSFQTDSMGWGPPWGHGSGLACRESCFGEACPEPPLLYPFFRPISDWRWHGLGPPWGWVGPSWPGAIRVNKWFKSESGTTIISTCTTPDV
jgi:hypothetical protein